MTTLFFNTSQESFTFIRWLPPWGKKGKSRSRTPSFFFWSHFRLIGPWWFQIIYQLATGNFIRIFPWGTAGCWTAESEHWHYIAKWMKVVELDESIFNTIWSLLFCSKNPCCAQCVRSWREKIRIYRVTYSFMSQCDRLHLNLKKKYSSTTTF